MLQDINLNVSPSFIYYSPLSPILGAHLALASLHLGAAPYFVCYSLPFSIFMQDLSLSAIRVLSQPVVWHIRSSTTSTIHRWCSTTLNLLLVTSFRLWCSTSSTTPLRSSLLCSTWIYQLLVSSVNLWPSLVQHHHMTLVTSPYLFRNTLLHLLIVSSLSIWGTTCHHAVHINLT